MHHIYDTKFSEGLNPISALSYMVNDNHLSEYSSLIKERKYQKKNLLKIIYVLFFVIYLISQIIYLFLTPERAFIVKKLKTWMHSKCSIRYPN